MYNPDVKVVIHVESPHKGTMVTWAGNLQDNNVDYDILATSYYPYWHGTLDILKQQFETVKNTYCKDVMVAETSYAYTLEDSDGHANTVRVPLNQKARDILERYKDLENALLPRFSHFGYNKKIKEILKYVGIDRMVRVLDPKTREDVARPLYEVATTHTARKTFIGNLYKQVKDPNLIASMSGHSEGSRAFARYRHIDDEIKKELVNLLD